MTYLIGIIIVLLVLGLIVKIIKAIFNCIYGGIKSLSNAVGSITLIITVILCIWAYYEFGWKGVLAAIAVGLGISFLMKSIGRAIAEHDAKRKAIALIKQQTKQQDRAHANELALQQKLDKNCRELGEMSPEKWKSKLGNYVNKQYETSFDQITANFSKEVEEQNILQNDDWFEPFLEEVVKRGKTGQGTRGIQLLDTVKSDQLKMTHSTPGLVLIERKLEELSKAVSDDVPAILEKKEFSGNKLYYLTEYGKKRYGLRESDQEKNGYHEIIEDDDI